MKLTPEKIVALKALAEDADISGIDSLTARLDLLHEKDAERIQVFKEYVPDLIADLEAAKEEHRPQIIALETELAVTRKKLAESERRYSESVGGFKRDLQQKLDDQRSKNVRLKAKIAEAQDLIEAYRKDAERLDLLGKLCKEIPLRPTAFCSEIAPDTRLRYDFPTLVSYDSVENQISLRDAIDALHYLIDNDELE